VQTADRADAIGWVKENSVTEIDVFTGLNEKEEFQKLNHNKTLQYHANKSEYNVFYFYRACLLSARFLVGNFCGITAS